MSPTSFAAGGVAPVHRSNLDSLVPRIVVCFETDLSTFSNCCFDLFQLWNKTYCISKRNNWFISETQKNNSAWFPEGRPSYSGCPSRQLSHLSWTPEYGQCSTVLCFKCCIFVWRVFVDHRLVLPRHLF